MTVLNNADALYVGTTAVDRVYAGATEAWGALGNYAAEVLADAPAVFLKLDEASGGSAADASGNARDFAAVDVTWGQASLFADGSGTSASLNGTSAYLGATSSAWMNSASVTAEWRYKHVASGATRLPVGRWGGSGERPWLVSVNSAGKVVAQINDSGIILTSATTLADATTYTVAFRTDGSTAKLFINGAEDASVAHAGITHTVGPFEIGRAAGAAFSPGNLDGFAFWSSAVSDGRLAAHHNAAATP